MAKFTLSLWSSTFPRLFPQCWCHWQRPSLLNIPCPAAEVSLLQLWGVSTRRQHFRIPHSPLSLMEPRGPWWNLPVWVVLWNAMCQRNAPGLLSPPTLSLWQMLTPEKSLSLRWLLFLGEGFEKDNWNRDPHQLETWRSAGFSKLFQHRGLTIPGMH